MKPDYKDHNFSLNKFQVVRIIKQISFKLNCDSKHLIEIEDHKKCLQSLNHNFFNVGNKNKNKFIQFFSLKSGFPPID